MKKRILVLAFAVVSCLLFLSAGVLAEENGTGNTTYNPFGAGATAGAIINGHYTYCIDPDKTWPGDGITYTNGTIDKSGITTEQQLQLKRVLEAGYPLDKYGFSKLDSPIMYGYFIPSLYGQWTQEVIWAIYPGDLNHVHEVTSHIDANEGGSAYVKALYNYALTGKVDGIEPTSLLTNSVSGIMSEMDKKDDGTWSGTLTFTADKGAFLSVVSIPDGVTLKKENDTINTGDILSTSDTISVIVNPNKFTSGDIQLSYKVATGIEDSLSLFSTTSMAVGSDGSTKAYQRMLGYQYSEKEETLPIPLNIETVTKTVEKVWNDNNNQDGKRESSVSIKLQKTVNGTTNDVDGKTATLNNENEWKVKFENLPKYENGKEIVYSVIETNVPEGYIAAYTTVGDTMTVTNKYTPKTIDKTVEKKWNDNANQNRTRPNNIQVQLYANGIKSGSPVSLSASLSANENWRYTWTNLPQKYKGEDIKYTVEEVTIPDGYSVAYDNNEMTITNTVNKVVISKKAMTGTEELTGATLKITDSEGNLIRQNGKDLTWQSDGTNQWTISGLKSGEYKLVEERAPEGYVVAESIVFSIDADGTVRSTAKDDNGVIIMKDDTTKVTISKQDITNNKEIAGAKLEVKDSKGKIVDHWTSDVTPHQINGQLIAGATYTLTETTAPNGYSKAEAITFTVNTDGSVKTVTMYDTPTTAIAGVKTWDDNNNQFGVRPESIVVYASGSDGSYTNQTVRPDASGNWTYSFADLPTADQNGKAITYTISEGAVKYYTASNTTGYNLTNKLGAPYSLTLNKKGDNGSLVPGAVYALYRKSDSGAADVKIGEYTTGNNGSVTASGLLSGSYYLKEVSAPNGYLVDPGTTDVVVAEGTVQTKDSVSVNVTDAAMKLYISKQDISNGKELSGAKLTITDTVTNKVVTEWVSDASVKTIDTSDFVADRVYVLTETKAPDGYNVAESIQFKIGADSKGQSMVSVLNNGQWTAVDNQTVIMKDAASSNPANPTGSNPSAPNVSPSAANPTGSNPSAPNLSPNNGGNTSTTAPNANASTTAGSGAGTGTNNGSGSNGSGSNGSGSGSSSGNANTGVNGDSLLVAVAALCALGALVISATYKRKRDK